MKLSHPSLRTPILAIGLSVAAASLMGCSARGDTASKLAAQNVLPNSFVTLGPIAGATVKVTDLAGNVLLNGTTRAFQAASDTVAASSQTRLRSYASGRTVGIIEMSPDASVQISSDWLYLVRVTGGQDIDPDDDGVIQSTEGNSGPQLKGQIFAVISGADLLKAGVRVNALTTMASAAMNGSTNKDVVIARINRLAAYIFKPIGQGGDLNGDGVIDYRDFYAYDPSRITFGASSNTRDDDAALRNASLIESQLTKTGANGKSFLDTLHSGGGMTEVTAFMVTQFGDANKDNLANVFEDPNTNDSDGNGIVDANDNDIDGDGLPNDVELQLGLNPWNKDSDGNGTADSSEDTDGDGLTNGDEVNVYHTDPMKKDTDGDGLNDGEEVLVYHTDPLKVDTDDDGISDGDEIHGFFLYDGITKVTTDPLNVDTDGDGIHDGIEKQVQDTFAKYPRPENAKAFLTGPLNPNNISTKPNLGGLSFTDTILIEAALEADPDGDGKPTIEEIFHSTDPNAASDTFQYVYEVDGSGAITPEFQAMQAANFVYIPGGWDVEVDGTMDSGFFMAQYPAKDAGTPIPSPLTVVDLLQGATVYNATTKVFSDRLCKNTAPGSDSDTSDATGSCRGNQYGDSGTTTISGGNVNQVVFTAQSQPYTGKSWLEARAALASSPVDPVGANGGPYSVDLPSEKQWMQVMQIIINNPTNWTSGKLGAGTLYRGHTDNNPSSPLAVTDPTDVYSDTGNSALSDTDQRRVFIIANGTMTRDFSLPLNHSVQLWDISGNVYEWSRSLIAAVDSSSTNHTRSGGDRFANGLSGLFDYDGTSITGTSADISSMPTWWKPQLPSAKILTRNTGAGIYNDGSPNSDTDGDGKSNGAYCSFNVGYGSGSFVDHFAAILRGGDFLSASNAGVASADLDNGVCRRLPTAGFRGTR